MNNADTPANPLTGDAYIDFADAVNMSHHSYNPECQGLTKREAFAMAAMQGTTACDVNNELTVSDIVEQAVSMADALLKQLEKEQ